MQQIRPTEIYNLAAQSHVAVSFESPEYTANADGIGVLRLLEAIRILGMEKGTRFYQASTSELYGLVQEIPQKETTPFYPRSPYGVAKLYGYWITVNYREAYGMYASNGILFNHESPTRGETFVTRKITRGVARIEVGLEDTVYLGNSRPSATGAMRGTMSRACTRSCRRTAPDDFVLATGETCSVREFVELRFCGSRPCDRMARQGRRRNRRRQQDWQDRGSHRSDLFPSDRGRPSDRRCQQGPGKAGLEAEDAVRPAGQGNGRGRSGDCQAGGRQWQSIPFELKGKTVFVAGHRGMVGSALVRRLAAEDVELLTLTAQRGRPARPGGGERAGLPPTRPQAVFLAAAKVGGIVANKRCAPSSSTTIWRSQTNLIHAAHVNRSAKSCCSSAPPASIPSWRRSRSREDSHADRAAGGDQRILCDRQDRRHQDGARPIAANMAPTSSA